MLRYLFFFSFCGRDGDDVLRMLVGTGRTQASFRIWATSGECTRRGDGRTYLAKLVFLTEFFEV